MPKYYQDERQDKLHRAECRAGLPFCKGGRSPLLIWHRDFIASCHALLCTSLCSCWVWQQDFGVKLPSSVCGQSVWSISDASTHTKPGIRDLCQACLSPKEKKVKMHKSFSNFTSLCRQIPELTCICCRAPCGGVENEMGEDESSCTREPVK